MGKIARLSKAGGPYAKKASVNKAFRTKHKISYSGPQNKAKKKANLQLREVEVPAFEALGGDEAAHLSKFADHTPCATRHEDLETHPKTDVLLAARPAHGMERCYSAGTHCRPRQAIAEVT